MTAHVHEMPKPTPSRMVAAELRAEMARQGMSGRELGRRMGHDSTWVSRHIGMTAQTSLTLEEILEMTEALGLSAERFLSVLLPRLDSNQQPSGYQSVQVREAVVLAFPKRAA